MLKEFKAFAMRGNVLDLAVGVLVGAAFGAVVSSFTEDVLTPVIAAFGGEPNLSELTVTLGRGVIRYGEFLDAVISFALVTLAIFGVVKVANRALRPSDAPAEPPTTRECPYCTDAVSIRARRCPHCTSELDAATA